MKPVRIQRSRITKQVSPNGLPIVYVGRPGKFGNPFKLVGDMIYGDASHRRGKILSPWIYIEPSNNPHIDWTKPLPEIVISLYQCWLSGLDKNYLRPVFPADDIKILKGKNLSCWCKPHDPCHADVLLTLANK